MNSAFNRSPGTWNSLLRIVAGGILFFMGFGISSAPALTESTPPAKPTKAQEDQVLASVDEALITRRDLKFWLFETRLNNPETRTLPNSQLLNEMLNQAIEEEVLYQGLWDPTQEPKDEEVESVFEENYKDYVKMARGSALMKLRLEEAGISEEEFRPWFRERILRALTIEDAISERTMQEDDSILDELPNSPASQYQLREIFVKAGTPRTLGNLTPEDWARAEQEIREVKVHLADNMAFEEAAKVFSDDPNTAPDGGELGWFAAEELNETLRAALAKTPRGGVTEPIKLENGFSIYRVESSKTVAQEQLEEIRELIRKRLIKDLFLAAEIQLAPGYTLTSTKADFE